MRYTVTSPTELRVGEVVLLEIELNTSLEDSGLIRSGGYLAKVPIREDCSSSGRSAGRSRSCSSWQVEIRMVENVEGFQAKGRVQTLVDREYTGDLRIELVVRDAAEGVSASIPVGPITRTRRRRQRRWTSRRDLREGGRIQITAVCLAGC